MNSITTEGTQSKQNNYNKSLDFKDLLVKIKAIKITEIANKLNLPIDTFIEVGGNIAGSCPSGHPSTSGASFHITPDKNLYHCWNCHEGGDSIELAKWIKNCTFLEAIKWIMKEFNFSEDLSKYIVDNRTPEQVAEANQLARNTMLYEELITWGRDLLISGSTPDSLKVLTYLLHDRKYKEEILKKTEFFFIPSEAEARKHLESKFPDAIDDIKKLPIKGGGYGDEFKINLPYRLFDKTITGLVKRHQSADGFAYTKDGKRLYARWDATPGLKKTDMFGVHGIDKKATSAIVVEGYPDSEYLRALGLPVIAFGSALPSEQQLRSLHKLKDLKLIKISLDNDETGLKNTAKLVKLISEHTGLINEVLPGEAMGNCKDLDEYFRKEGIDSLEELLDTKTILGIFWYIENMKNDNNGKVPPDKVDELYQLAASLTNGAEAIFSVNIKKYTDIPLRNFKSTMRSIKEKRLRESYSQDSLINPIKKWMQVPFVNTKGYWLYDREKQIPDPSLLDTSELRNYMDYDRVSKISSKGLLDDLSKSLLGTKVDIYPTLDITYDPKNIYEVDVENKMINTFIPTDWMYMEKNDDIISPPIHFPVINDFISDVLGQDDNIDVQWILNWLSVAFNKRDKLLTSLVIVGQQGAGKNVFVDLIIKYLFGIPNVAVVSDSELNSRYNGYMSEKLFVVFNELSPLKDSKRDAQIKIKGMVTENMLMMEKKFQDAVAMRNYFNVIFISNFSVPIVIDPDDRRFCCIRVPRQKLHQSPLFTKRGWGEKDYEEYRSKVGEEFPKFVQYLLNLKYDELKANTAIMNNTKRAMVDENTTIYEKFGEALKNRDTDALEFMQLNGTTYSQNNPYKWEEEHLKEGIISVNQALIIINNGRTFSGNISPTILNKKLVEQGIKKNRLSIPYDETKRPYYFILPSSEHYKS